MIMTRPSKILAVVAMLVTPVPASSQTPPTAEIRSPFQGLAPGETLLVRLAETRSGAPATRVFVAFFNERNLLVRPVATALVTSGNPATFEVNRTDLPDARVPSVRIVVQLQQQDNGLLNALSYSHEFVDVQRATVRSGGTCLGGVVTTGTGVPVPIPTPTICDAGAVYRGLRDPTGTAQGN
jgi:hypothetical protein